MQITFLKNYSTKLILSFVFFLLSVFLFAVITNEVVMEKEQNIDLAVFEFFKSNIIRNGLNSSMELLTYFCSPTFVKIGYPVIICSLLIFKYYREAIFAFLAGAGGLILIYLIKTFFHRPRPPYPLLYKEEGYSFPSGHATFSFILYGMLAYFVWLSNVPKIFKTLMIIFLMLLSLGIGISRIYLMVHYPSDVLAGFCLGYSWLLMLIFWFRRKFPLGF